MEYQVTGEIKIGNEWQPYKKTVDAPNESGAAERFLTLVGSKHRLKRTYIRIQGIQKIDGE
ncbi:MAG: 50S ribosomal protein L18a [Methanomicrobiales archaeon]|nr:50S ribosomal protein L18a [Methanomicrobiales archaeon]